LWTNRGTSLQTPPRRFAPPSLPGGLPPATLPPVALNPPPLPPVTNFPDITTTPQASLPTIPTAPVFQPTTPTPPLLNSPHLNNLYLNYLNRLQHLLAQRRRQ
jgi:hypothetical protein